MSDQLIRAVTEDAPIKISAVTLRQTVERARQIHHTTPLATAALGRTLAAASMMGAELKEVDGSVTIQIRGDGPLGTILAVGDCQGDVRGYVHNPGADLPLRPSDGKIDVAAGVGRGMLTVIKDIGLKEPFHGTVELISGEIATDVAAYFLQSEQVPTVCALGVLVDRDYTVRQAGGYLIQLMPGADEKTIDLLERAAGQARPVTAQLDEGMTMEDILSQMLPSFSLRVLERHAVGYRCHCSREKVEGALISLGREELAHLQEQEDETQITCQFCDAVYTFSHEEIAQLLRGAGGGRG